MSTQEQRERFEAWKTTVPPVHREETACMWAAWQAAETAAIERCAKVCDEHLYAEKAAEAIRALLPKEE